MGFVWPYVMAALTSLSYGMNAENAGVAHVQQQQGDSAVINSVDSDADFSHMYFGTENSTVVTSQTGSTSHLPCIVHNVGDGMVSWIRRKDRHLITVGVTTYNADQRYQVIHLQHSEDWTLQIKFVQKRDAGIYECQVSSHPPTSIFIQLNVVEARAQISGSPEKYIKPGSALRLQCIVLKATETPSYMFWYHNSRMINFDTDSGVNVTTDLGARTSFLVIPVTSYSHAGNYSCVPNNAIPASIYVHVFNGENPAAMQSSACSVKPLLQMSLCICNMLPLSLLLIVAIISSSLS